MDKKLEFLDRVIDLCYEYGLCIVSDDPHEGVDIAVFDFDNSVMYDGLYRYLLNG